MLFRPQTRTVRFWSADQMQKVDSLIASNMDPARHLGRRAVYGLAFEMYRVGPSEGEIHEKPADFIVVGEGEGTLLVGGKLVGGKPSGPDEKRGPAIDGGQKYQLRPADVIYVPANTGAGGFPPRRKKCGLPHKRAAASQRCTACRDFGQLSSGKVRGHRRSSCVRGRGGAQGSIDMPAKLTT